MVSVEGDHGDAAELLHAQSGLWNHIYNYIDSMSLKCAVELGVPDAIHRHGGPITLSDLSAALALPPSKTSHLRRVMRVLTNSGVFSCTHGAGNNEVTYNLTRLSRLLVRQGADAGLSPLLLAALDPFLMAPFQYMATWFRGDSPSPFAEAHGCGFWDKANQDADFNKTFNAAMASDATFLAGLLVEECAGVFKGLSSLVDVGGGTGSAAKAIAQAFPEVKCSVLDLPQVIDTLTKEPGTISFIPGDMFQHIPSANAVLLKWILHNWSDEDCVKILKKCKEAIPSKEEGGKVIIIDMVVGAKNSHIKAMETQLHFDMMMMVLFDAIERNNDEWKKVFAGAGFTDYKITQELGLRSIIELYP